MYRLHLATGFLGALFLMGCPSTERCPDGTLWYPDEGVCRIPNPEHMDGGDGDAGTDVGGDVPCGGCTAPLVCDTATGECEECVGDDASSCGADLNACVANTCVACAGNDDCTEPDASLCTAGNECTGCAADPDCTHLTATPVCDEASNTCVACTIDTEAARCGANSCDVATGACTSTPRTSVRRCGGCVADSECMQADDRCVPMEFMGTARAGGYCLKRGSTGCTPPYGIPTAARASLSGAAAEVYCGIPESVTTCEAVLDLVDDVGCATDEECGADGLNDGLCESVNLMANKCTYGCTATSQCVAGFLCPSMTYCGSL